MKKVIVLLKIMLSLGCLYAASSRIDFELAQEFLYSTISIRILIIATLLMCLQILLSVFRLNLLLKILSHPITFGNSLNISWVGSFFSQMAFSFISGDAIRVWYLKKSLKTLTVSFYAIVIDRVFGLIALGVLFLLILPFLSQIPQVFDHQLIIFKVLFLGTFAAATCAILLYCFRNQSIKVITFIQFMQKSFLQKPFNTFLMLFVSILIHCCNVVMVYNAFRVFGISVSLMQCVIIMVPTMLAMMLSVSVGGWGIRENAMLIGFSTLNLAPEPILTTSILLGLSLLIASLPGFFLFLFNKPNKPLKEIDSPYTKNGRVVVTA